MTLPRALRPSGKLKRLGISSSKGIKLTPSPNLKRLGLRPLGDFDRDGVKNFADCAPRNPRKQGIFHDIREKFAEERALRVQKSAQSDGRLSNEDRQNIRSAKERVDQLREQGDRIRTREIAREKQRVDIEEQKAKVRKARMESRPQIKVGQAVAAVVERAGRAAPRAEQFLTGRSPSEPTGAINPTRTVVKKRRVKRRKVRKKKG